MTTEIVERKTESVFDNFENWSESDKIMLGDIISCSSAVNAYSYRGIISKINSAKRIAENRIKYDNPKKFINNKDNPRVGR